MKGMATLLVAITIYLVFCQIVRADTKTRDSITSGLLCIHRYEGAWNAHTGNGYYGGLQMDLNFQRAYGYEFLKLWGTADHWPIWAQLAAGARGYVHRGWQPWPNTARKCGLL